MKVIALTLAALGLTLGSLPAATYVIPVAGALDRGSYDVYGVRLSGNNYLAGDRSGTALEEEWEYRNYFIFDLSSIPATETITGATFQIYQTFTNSNDSTETFAVFSVDRTTTTALRASSESDGKLIFQDLGDGTAFSSGFVVTSAHNFSQLSIPLNTAFVHYAQAQGSGEVALGGRVTSLTGQPGVEGMFWGTDSTDPRGNMVPLSATRLVITTIPEPSTIGFLCVGSALLFRRPNRRRTGSFPPHF